MGALVLSSRIEQSLAVLAEVWSRRPIIGAIRSQAERSVAGRLRLRPQTVHDKLVRQLGLACQDLDNRIAQWLGGDPVPLRSSLLARAITPADREAILELLGQAGTPL